MCSASALHVPGVPEHSLAEFSRAALSAAWQGCGWAWTATIARLCGTRSNHLADGERYALEYRMTMPGAQEGWIEERAFPVASQRGQMARLAGVSKDITAHKNADLELRRSDRRKNEFLPMVAHELRNPLGAHPVCRGLAGASARRRPGANEAEGRFDHRTTARPPHASGRRPAGRCARRPRKSRPSFRKWSASKR